MVYQHPVKNRGQRPRFLFILTLVPTERTAHRIGRILTVVVVGLFVCFLVVLNILFPLIFHFRKGPALPRDAAALPAGVPAPTAQDTVAVQKGFQYLVSYTDQGLLPGELSIQEGETVRFTNSTNAAIFVTLGGVRSALLSQGMYWEHTFDALGTQTFSMDTKQGTITVQ